MRISKNIQSITKLSATMSLIFALGGCGSTDNSLSHVEQSLAEEITNFDRPVEAAPELAQTPESVSDTLMGSDTTSPAKLIEAERYDISARDVPARSFFSGLVKDTPYSVAIHPDVKGDISLELKQVSLDEIFDLVTDMFGYHVERHATIYRIFPAGLHTEIFSVNYLMMQRAGQTQTSIISGGVAQGSGGSGGFGQNNFNSNQSSGSSNSSTGGLAGLLGGGSNRNSNPSSNQGSGGFSGSPGNNGTVISTSSESNFWRNLETSLMKMIGDDDGRAVLVSPQAGLVTVRAYPDELTAIRRFLDASEQSLTRQVVIEARILEVDLSDEYQQGINWSNIAASIGDTNISFATTPGNLGNVVSTALGGLTGITVENQDFTSVINLLDTQGDVQTLSSPRVTAVNNQKAVIKVGDDEYFVTDISSQNTITASSTSIVPDIELTPFFSGIALDVTPQIDESGNILLHVNPSVIETEEQEKIVTLNQEQIVLPLAQSTIRESDTIVRATSGEIVVIGGLMQSVKQQTESKTPLLGDIPYLGNLFKNKKEVESKKELVILLKPTVVDESVWQNEIKRSRSQISDWLYVE